MQENILQILIQGGLASIALVSLYILYKLVSNHMEHTTKSQEDLTIAITRLIQFLGDKIK